MATHAAEDDQEKQPLIKYEESSVDDPPNLIQKAYRSTAHLANHLPTGTALAFQVLSPVLTNQGRCTDANRVMASCLLALCALSCCLLSFTDSFRDEATGRVRYGLATLKGLWVIDGLKPLPPELAAGYRLRLVDLLHAFTSLLVFAAVALLDKNVASCFYPTPSEETRQVLSALPVGIGVIGSTLLVAFPTSRHGIGFPLSPDT
ncbi:protein DMP4 [Musa acuminata AAA Group]|uniref:protein DMP4 n=1 Tax=Musa acuminata AAA Group TaxID=214697 RepID=UPI0031DD14E7